MTVAIYWDMQSVIIIAFFHAGTYRISVKDTESEYVSCANISKPKDNECTDYEENNNMQELGVQICT